MGDRPLKNSKLAPIVAAAARANPGHVGLIMDGNGRWAEHRGEDRTKGHEAGLKTFHRILRASAAFGVPILSVFGFSAENWARPQAEVAKLMALLVQYLQDYRHEFLDQDCRFLVTGRRDQLAPEIQALVALAEQETSGCQSRLLNLALSYGGRQELVDAAKQLAVKAKAGVLDPSQIDNAAFAAHLYAPDLPDPDLIIRTSGEQRLSGFLPWQSAYSELMFHDALWPDFSPEMFLACLEAYRRRKRRFGLVETRL